MGVSYVSAVKSTRSSVCAGSPEAGGTTPSPILADYAPEATEHNVTFPAAGLFGYVCGQHSGMQGAIQVVD